MNFFTKILIGIYHAKYHKNFKKALRAKDKKNIHQFKKYIYRAEDAWRHVVILTNKNKKK